VATKGSWLERAGMSALSRGGVVCPNCHQAEPVQRVSRVYSPDTPLAPPAKPGDSPSARDPSDDNILRLILVVLIMVGPVVCLKACDPLPETRRTEWGPSILGCTVPSLVAGAVFWRFLTNWLPADPRQERKRWNKALNRWQQLRYCASCDGVFLPGQPALTPVADVPTFLYDDTVVVPRGKSRCRPRLRPRG
jgi:hypothetical protein